MQGVQAHTLIPPGSAFATPCNTGYYESVTASPAGVRHVSVLGFARFPKDMWYQVSFLWFLTIYLYVTLWRPVFSSPLLCVLLGG